jgi:hypothetical protein
MVMGWKGALHDDQNAPITDGICVCIVHDNTDEEGSSIRAQSKSYR